MAEKCAPSRQVSTSCGPIAGLRVVHEEDRPVDAFFGIPYAKPPIGPLRFKKPEPNDGWTEVRQCTAFGFRAIQKDPPMAKPGATAPSEDCLTLNVFSPAWKPEAGGFPVLVYIHGGNYLSGGTSQLGYQEICENLCKKGVITVTVQYRLGYLGFWNMGSSSCNLALWDLTMALSWIRDNIGYFNGNPDNVTVMGQSSGGSLADILALSPHSRHLVHKVIGMSGNASAEWAFRDTHLGFCRKFMEGQGIDLSQDSETILEQLREIPAEKFGLSLYEIGLGERAHLGLVIDGDFIPKTPAELRKETPPKPYLLGVPSSDGLFSGMSACSSVEDIKSVAVKIFPEADFPPSVREEYVQKVVSLIEKGNNKQWSILQAHTDESNGVATMATAVEELEKGADVYLYRINYYNPRMFDKMPMAPVRDATHCTDVTLVLGRCVGLPFEFNDDDKKMLHLMSTLWTNFAKYGNPNGEAASPLGGIKWLPLTAEDRERHLLITQEPRMDSPYFDGRPLWCLEQTRKYRRP